jgi:ADP-dependent NAD(P)H-hydrate dehydratase / NAD(P)H-hydrate epimerase
LHYKPVAVVTASEARERDARAIASGISSRTLMQNAGVAAAAEIMRLLKERPGSGVEIYVGPGNNGGDGWVVAGELSRNGVPVRVLEAETARSSDALDAKSKAPGQTGEPFQGQPAIVVDALLGTGSRGSLSGAILDSVHAIADARNRGAIVIALDVPTGLDATTGKHEQCVVADLTLSFGTLKRGHLTSRGVCGAVKVLDIGLGEFGYAGDADIMLASPGWVSEHIPSIAPDAHKGTRKRLAIIAGDEGMAGAAILSGQAALRSGIGLLHLVVASANRDAAHCAVPATVLSTHEELANDPSGVLDGAAALVVGPGLLPQTAQELLSAISTTQLPIVLDAGGLAAFAGDIDFLHKLCDNRKVILTPHPAELGRLLGMETQEVLDQRFELGGKLARETGATVLLKGTPTIISSPLGTRMVTATGTPALATGGSGDLLSGIIGTLLAQTGNPFESAACAAWVHGRAAELCGPARGVILEDILFALPAAWNISSHSSDPMVLASLPIVQ